MLFVEVDHLSWLSINVLVVFKKKINSGLFSSNFMERENRCSTFDLTDQYQPDVDYFWPGNWYSVISHQKKSEGDSHSVGSQRMSSDHVRISRAVPGRGLTIITLPDNITRIVVSAAPQLSLGHFWRLLFVLAGLTTCHFARLMSADGTLWPPVFHVYILLGGLWQILHMA